MKRVRIIVDVLMFICYITLMGYHIVTDGAHEILGVITFGLFIIHHILNIRWYKSIFKGKYNLYRVIQIIIDMLLLVSMIGIMASSMMISSTVFSFLGLKTTQFGRNLHLISTSWGFVLMGIHLGMHLNVILYKFNKKMKESTFEYVYYLIMILFMLYGLYAFVSTEMWKDMFLVNEFKFFDYNQSPILFYLGEVGIACLFAFVVYFALKLKKKKVK